MKNIVLLSTIYLNKPSANGICARNLAASLIKKGNKVSVICYREESETPEEEQVEIYTVQKPDITTHKVIPKLTNIIRSVFTPQINSSLVQDYYKKICEINELTPVDAVIAMFFPLEAVEAVRLFKRRHGDVSSIVYELDSIVDGVVQTPLKLLFDKAYERWLRKTYQIFDDVFIMQSHEEYWKKTFGKEFIDKLTIVDLPVLKDNTNGSVKTNDLTVFVYSGIIEERYRSPKLLLETLERLSEKSEFEFYFFSRGDCEEKIAEKARKIPGIKQMGYVAPEVLEETMQKADFFVSIGNSISHSVPSKIIEYLSYGKPIIHFSLQKNDVCNEYSAKYPLALVIDQTLSAKQACEMIESFIKENCGKRVDYSSVKQLFPMNEPKYSADIILRVLSNQREN